MGNQSNLEAGAAQWDLVVVMVAGFVCLVLLGFRVTSCVETVGPCPLDHAKWVCVESSTGNPIAEVAP